MLCNQEREVISKNYKRIIAELVLTLKHELDFFEQQLSQKLEDNEYESNTLFNKKNKAHLDLNKLFQLESETNKSKEKDNYREENELLTISLKIDSWDIYYICLCIFEKLINNYSRLTKELLKNDTFFHLTIFKSLKHPHSFIKSVSLRLIGYILSEQISNAQSGQQNSFSNFILT